LNRGDPDSEALVHGDDTNAGARHRFDLLHAAPIPQQHSRGRSGGARHAYPAERLQRPTRPRRIDPGDVLVALPPDGNPKRRATRGDTHRDDRLDLEPICPAPRPVAHGEDSVVAAVYCLHAATPALCLPQPVHNVRRAKRDRPERVGEGHRGDHPFSDCERHGFNGGAERSTRPDGDGVQPARQPVEVELDVKVAVAKKPSAGGDPERCRRAAVEGPRCLEGFRTVSVDVAHDVHPSLRHAVEAIRLGIAIPQRDGWDLCRCRRDVHKKEGKHAETSPKSATNGR
jgi:hypothetical protein